MTLSRLAAAGLLLSLIPSFLAAQPPASLQGRVLAPDDTAIEGAEISVTSEDARTLRRLVSGDDGAYRVERLPAGRYLIRVRAQGFAVEARETLLEPGQASRLDFQLSIKNLDEQIVVVASGAPQTEAATAKSVTVLGREFLESRDEFEVSEALRSAPGMRIARLGGPGAFTTIKTRGLRNQDTAFLIDGIRFRDASAVEGDATSFLENFNLVAAERLEILRGSGSSLYGSNAIGGVVNLITDPGGGPARGSVLLEGGGLGLLRGRARAAGGSEGAFAFSAGISHVNVTDGEDGDDAYRNSSVQGAASWTPGVGMRLSGRIYAGDAFSQLNDSSFAVPDENLPPSGIVEPIPLAEEQIARLESGLPADFGAATFVPALNDPDNHRASRFFNGLLKWDHHLGPRFGYTVAYNFVGTGREFRDGPGGQRFEPPFNTFSDLDGRIHLLRASADYRLGRSHTVTAGYEFERQRFISTNRAPDTFARSQTDEDSHSFFVQDRVGFFDERLQLSLAGRAQAFRVDQPRFEGGNNPFQDISRFDAPPTAYTADGSIAYFPAPGTKLRAHVGNGYRAPSLFNRLGTTFFQGFFSAFGDPRLRPERSISFDVGVDQEISQRYRLGATYFYTRLQETIIFDFSGRIDPSQDPFGRFGGYLNAEGGISRGLEFEAQASPAANLDLRASYAYTNSDLASDTAGTIFSRSLGVSDHIFTLNASLRPSRRVELNFDLYAASNYLTPLFSPAGTQRLFEFEGPVKADLGASYSFRRDDRSKVRLYTRIENLFDDAYFENGFPTPGLTARGGIAYDF